MQIRRLYASGKNEFRQSEPNEDKKKWNDNKQGGHQPALFYTLECKHSLTTEVKIFADSIK